MAEIFNEAKKHEKMVQKKFIVPKNTADVQKRKIDKLMSNPEKTVYIPEGPKEWKPKNAPEFVRDVMGSSAGAGSGEFHVYRHIRRREYNRQKFMSYQDKKQKLDEEYALKQANNQKAAEEATAKKRAKRLKRKQNMKNKKKTKKTDTNDNCGNDSKSESASETEESKEKEIEIPTEENPTTKDDEKLSNEEKSDTEKCKEDKEMVDSETKAAEIHEANEIQQKSEDKDESQIDIPEQSS